MPIVASHLSPLFANLKRTVAPTLSLVTLDSVKQHLRIDFTDDDELIQAYIEAATEKLENDTRRGFITQTWAQKLDDFYDDLILLRRCPVIAISSVVYIDADGASQTVTASDYQVDVTSEPARLMPAYGETWPTARYDTFNAVTITFTVGYGAAGSASPKAALQAVKLLTAHYYNMRCPVAEAKYAEVPLGYQALVDSLRWE